MSIIQNKSMNKQPAKLQQHLLLRLLLTIPKFFSSRQEKSFRGENFQDVVSFIE